MKVMQSVSFIHQEEDRIYHLSFPVPAPLKECYAVCATVLGELDKKIKEAAEAEAKKEEVAKVSEPVKE